MTALSGVGGAGWASRQLNGGKVATKCADIVLPTTTTTTTTTTPTSSLLPSRRFAGTPTLPFTPSRYALPVILLGATRCGHTTTVPVSTPYPLPPTHATPADSRSLIFFGGPAAARGHRQELRWPSSGRDRHQGLHGSVPAARAWLDDAGQNEVPRDHPDREEPFPSPAALPALPVLPALSRPPSAICHPSSGIRYPARPQTPREQLAVCAYVCVCVRVRVCVCVDILGLFVNHPVSPPLPLDGSLACACPLPPPSELPCLQWSHAFQQNPRYKIVPDTYNILR